MYKLAGALGYSGLTGMSATLRSHCSVDTYQPDAAARLNIKPEALMPMANAQAHMDRYKSRCPVELESLVRDGF